MQIMRMSRNLIRITRYLTSMVMGVKTNKLVRLKAKAESRKPSWYFSAVDDDFHGCRYANDATAIEQHTPTSEKYAGNILLCRLPNWCLGRFLIAVNGEKIDKILHVSSSSFPPKTHNKFYFIFFNYLANWY